MEDDSEEYRKNLQRQVKQEPVRLDTDGEMWDKIHGKIEEFEKQGRRIPLYWYASAASLFIILTIGLAYIYLKGTNTQTGDIIAHKVQKEETISNRITDTTESIKTSVENHKVIPQSEEETLKLDRFKTSEKVETFRMADGSEITLNVSGDISIKTYHNNNIEVNLSGEAYFDVPPGLNRSFKVNFGQSSLEVIGTRFSVRNIPEENQQEVMVSEGIVKVTMKNIKEVTLKKEAFLQINNKTGTYEVRNVTPSHYLSWKTGRLSFEETPLPEVAAVLSRVYKIRIEVDSNIKSCTFTGDLSQMTLEDALKVIEATTSTEINNNTIHVIKISGTECN